MIHPAGFTAVPPPAGFAFVSSGAPFANPDVPVLIAAELKVPGPNGPVAP